MRLRFGCVAINDAPTHVLALHALTGSPEGQPAPAQVFSITLESGQLLSFRVDSATDSSREVEVAYRETSTLLRRQHRTVSHGRPDGIRSWRKLLSLRLQQPSWIDRSDGAESSRCSANPDSLQEVHQGTHRCGTTTKWREWRYHPGLCRLPAHGRDQRPLIRTPRELNQQKAVLL